MNDMQMKSLGTLKGFLCISFSMVVHPPRRVGNVGFCLFFFLPFLREASKEEKHDSFLLVLQIDVRGRERAVEIQFV